MAEPSAEICLVLENVSQRFGGLLAVDNVNLTVTQGERLAIIGPNGAGKTTLFNIISGEICPTAGKVIMYGRDVTHLPNHKRVYLGLARTFQITQLFFELTVLENVILALLGTRPEKFSMLRPLKRYGAILEEAFNLLGKVGLQDKARSRVKELSYGDQRLLELVLALASKPRIIALDEPTAGLSAAESHLVIDALNNLDRGITLLLIEHDLKMVFEVVERIMVLHQGRVVALGPNDEVRRNQQVQQIYMGAVS
ncbi:MAG: ABC transporter ATP-binding protein [Bacillota bacterium]